ncbi:hypothetical protein vseg_007427 [Gypsophila vaccaria]
MRRFALVVRPGDVMDVGLSYIGQLGQNLKSIILGDVGESDRGLIELCRSCRGLQKLEILDCPFTEHGLIVAATQCVYLKYLWALRYRASIEGIEKIQGIVPPYWKVEFICNDQLVSAHMLVYHSHLDSRTDRPDIVYFLGETSITRTGTTQGGMRVWLRLVIFYADTLNHYKKRSEGQDVGRMISKVQSFNRTRA